MKWFAILTMIILISTGCNNDQNGIPYFPINITIYTDDPQWIGLAATGGFEYVSGGSKGLIVFRISPDEFMAYERHTPYQPDQDCRVTVDSTGIVAEDMDCSGSRFNLFNGSVIEGPATLPLHAYRTTFINGVLTINN